MRVLLVEDHPVQGSMEVESKVGQGSCFTVILPLASPSPTQTAPQRDSPA